MPDLRAFSLPGRLSAISLPTLPDPAAIPPAVILSVVVVALILLVYVVFVRRVIQNLRLLRAQSREGRRVSAELSGPQPLTNFTRVGVPSDPLNIKLVATEAQLATAFAAAGWLRADELAMVTAMRITVDSLLRRAYPSAPVSSLYLYGRPQDFAFQRPGTSARERDHVRFWDTGECASDERPIWIGGATRDVDIELACASATCRRTASRRTWTPSATSCCATWWRRAGSSSRSSSRIWPPGAAAQRQRPRVRHRRAHRRDLAGHVPVLLPLATETHGPLAGGSRAVAAAALGAAEARAKLAKERRKRGGEAGARRRSPQVGRVNYEVNRHPHALGVAVAEEDPGRRIVKGMA